MGVFMCMDSEVAIRAVDPLWVKRSLRVGAVPSLDRKDWEPISLCELKAGEPVFEDRCIALLPLQDAQVTERGGWECWCLQAGRPLRIGHARDMPHYGPRLYKFNPGYEERCFANLDKELL